MTEQASRAGGPVIKAEEITSADQQSMVGDGTWLHPLSSTGTGVSGIVVAQVQAAPFTAEAGNVYPLLGHPIPDPPLPPDVFDANLPSAASVGNGAAIGFVRVNPGLWQLVADGTDTIGDPDQGVYELGDSNYVELVSNGVNGWYVRFLVVF